MARLVIGSILMGSTTTRQQIFTTARPRVLEITMTARQANTDAVYIGSDSGVNSSTGYIMPALSSAVEVNTQEFKFRPASVAGTTFWVFGTNSADRLDYAALMED